MAKHPVFKLRYFWIIVWVFILLGGYNNIHWYMQSHTHTHTHTCAVGIHTHTHTHILGVYVCVCVCVCVRMCYIYIYFHRICTHTDTLGTHTCNHDNNKYNILCCILLYAVKTSQLLHNGVLHWVHVVFCT